MKKIRSIDAMDPVKSKAQNENNQDRKRKKRSIDATDHELRDRQKIVDKNWQRDRRDKNPNQVKTGSFEMSIEEAINKSVKKAKKYLHRTKKEDDGAEHTANVCIVCDCFIIGIESIRYLHANAIKKHKHQIGVELYETYYKTKLHKELIE